MLVDPKDRVGALCWPIVGKAEVAVEPKEKPVATGAAVDVAG